MKPPRCPACHSRSQTHGPLKDQSFVRFAFGFWKWVPVRASVCLDCGTVTPYLDDAALTKLRGWKGYGVKEPIDEL